MSHALVSQLLEIFPSLQRTEAEHLLRETDNNVERAVARHLQQGQSAAATGSKINPTTHAHRKQPNKARKRDREEEEEELLDDDQEATADTTTSVSVSSPLPPPPSSSVASPSSSRVGSGSGSGGKRGNKSAKKDVQQRSLDSFFGSGSNKSPASHTVASIDKQQPLALQTTTDRSSAAQWALFTPGRSGKTTPHDADERQIAIGNEHPLTDESSSVAGLQPDQSIMENTTVLGPPCWSPPARVPYLHLARTFHAIEQETGRILITNYLTLMFWRIIDLSPADLHSSVSLTTNQLAAPYENLQLHIGGSLVSRIIRETTGRSYQQMHADYKRLGDLGDLAQSYRITQPMLVRPAPLTVHSVYNSIISLSKLVGPGNTKKKEELVKRLLLACREQETRYLVRTILQDLRIGAVMTTVLAALAKAFVLQAFHSSKQSSREGGSLGTWERVIQATQKDSNATCMQTQVDATTPPTTISSFHSLHALIKQAAQTLRYCYSQHPNLRHIIPSLLLHPFGIFNLLQSIHLSSGVPTKPMLGKISKGIAHMLKKLKGQPFTCEIKYDGLRAQIHRCSDGSYKIFSRHLMEQSQRWQDLWSILDQSIQLAAQKNSHAPVSTFIIDAEIVAVEVTRNVSDASSSSSSSSSSGRAAVVDESLPHSSVSFRILPFQTLTTRKRKVDGKMNVADVEVKCMIYAFDMILLDEQPLLQQPLPVRRDQLSASFAEIPGAFMFVEHVDVSQAESQVIVIEEDEEAENDSATTSNSSSKRGKAVASSAKRKGSSQPKNTEQADEDDEAVLDAESEAESGDEEDAIDDASRQDQDDDPTFINSRPGSASLSKDKHSRALEVTDADLFSNEADDEEDVVVVEEEEKRQQPQEHKSTDGGTTQQLVDAGSSAYQRIIDFLHHMAIVRGEGLMAKSLSPHSTYEPDLRTDSWIKLKRDYIAGLSVGDSLDVVPIGAWWGNGRKAGWYSPILLAVWNPDEERFESLCKCMSGFTDIHYQEMLTTFAPHIIPAGKPYYYVQEGLYPSVWFDAKFVWEIRGADLTISPAHTAAKGLIDPHKGISLRFPRFIRVREDKGVEDATTSEQIAELYQLQHRNK